jgi:hypothetical protein
MLRSVLIFHAFFALFGLTLCVATSRQLVHGSFKDFQSQQQQSADTTILAAATSDNITVLRSSFPKGFIFGTATAAYQVRAARSLSLFCDVSNCKLECEFNRSRWLLLISDNLLLGRWMNESLTLVIFFGFCSTHLVSMDCG